MLDILNEILDYESGALSEEDIVSFFSEVSKYRVSVAATGTLWQNR